MENTEQLRRHNAETLRAALLAAPGSSKAALARSTGLSQATCNTIINELVLAGEVLELAESASRGGRPAAHYVYNKDYANLLCVALTNDDCIPVVHLRVYDLVGTQVAKIDTPAPGLDPALLIQIVGECLAGYPKVVMLVLSIPGVVPDGHSIAHCDIAGLVNTPVSQLLEDAFSLPVYAENDVNLALMGYHHLQKLPPELSVAGVLFPRGNGAGGGYYTGSRILRGAQGFAGEVNWLPCLRGYSTDAPPQRIAAYAADTAVSMVAVLNPDIFLFSGSAITDELYPQIVALCREGIPATHLPRFDFLPDMDELYFEGLFAFASAALSRRRRGN